MTFDEELDVAINYLGTSGDFPSRGIWENKVLSMLRTRGAATAGATTSSSQSPAATPASSPSSQADAEAALAAELVGLYLADQPTVGTDHGATATPKPAPSQADAETAIAAEMVGLYLADQPPVPHGAMTSPTTLSTSDADMEAAALRQYLSSPPSLNMTPEGRRAYEMRLAELEGRP